MAEQTQNTETQEAESKKIIRQHVIYAVGGGIVPIPLLDLAAITATQLNLIKRLCTVYDVNYDQGRGNAILTTLTSTTLSSVGASLLKVVPIVGSIVGGLSLSVVAGASTYAVGQVFVRHFSAGGTMQDFKASAFREYYKEMFEQGKTVAKEEAENVKKGKKVDLEVDAEIIDEDTPAAGQDLLARMEQLAKLRESGAISEAEFQKLKDKLMKEL